MPLIVPSGVPAWVRTVSIADYGGHVSKENYLSRGAIDPLTDVGAEEFSRQVGDLAACARTQPFAIVTFDCNDTSPADPTIQTVLMMPGIWLASYPGDSAPSGFPSGARQGTGDVDIIFASSYLDEYGVSGAFVPTQAKGTAHGIQFCNVTCNIAGTTINVRFFDAAGAAASNRRGTIMVW